MRYEELRAVKISMLVFWIVKQCGLAVLTMERACSSETLVST
jgi:hypothetical protein